MDQRSPHIFIITGDPGSGKTSFLSELILSLRKRKITMTGFLSPSFLSGNQGHSYKIQNIETGERLPLSSRKFTAGWIRIGNFFFNPEALLAGNRILNNPGFNDYNLIIIDEVGPFELNDKIWADSISKILSLSNGYMIWVVRKNLVQEVIKKWNLKNTDLIDIQLITLAEAEKMIISGLISD